MNKREKRQYPLDGKTMFGLSTMRFTAVAGTSLMTTAFMMYLTDYSGLANATFISTLLLLIGRILDVVDDPVQGWIMDNGKKTKIGKFKPFMIGGIIITTIALILLFNIPTGIPEWSKVALLFFAYILYEMGFSFQPDMALKSTMTVDTTIRKKLLIVPRAVEQIIVVPFSFFITLALMFGSMFGGDNHMGFGVATAAIILPLGIIAFIGICMVKEGPHINNDEEKIKIREVFRMFRQNKPLWILQLSSVVGGCVFTFIMTAAAYYIKWAYGPENFATNSAIWGMCILFGMLIGTFVASPVLKKLIPIRAGILGNVLQIIPLAIMFIISLFGVINIYVFFIGLFIVMLCAGMNFIPGTMMNMECMDYNKWKGGKGMEGMVQAVVNLVNKAQTAIAGLVTGAVLVAIHYDAALYESPNFAASGGTIPEALLPSLAIVACLIPVVLGLAAIAILTRYPIKGKVREDMYRALEEQRGNDN